MSLPIILVCGEAGSGKDTVSEIITKYLQGTSIAQADPIKRFISKTFGFSNLELWGASRNRNALVADFSQQMIMNRVLDKVANESEDWLREVLPNADDAFMNKAYYRLVEWANGLMESAKTDGGLTPRKVLQTLGTEWGRSLSPDMWVDYAMVRAMGLLQGGCDYSASTGVRVDLGNSGHGVVVITDGRFRNEILGVKKAGGLVIKVAAPESPDVNEAEKAGIIGHKSESEQRTIPSWYYDGILTNDKSHGLEQCQSAVINLLHQIMNTQYVRTAHEVKV